MAAGSTYTPIATTTLGSAAATVTLSSIPSTYTDIVAVCSMLATSNGVSTPKFYLNNDGTGTTLYSETDLSGTGSAAQSGRNSNSYAFDLYWGTYLTTTSPKTAIINFQNYSNTTTYKSALCRFSEASAGEVGAMAYLYRSTSAINRIDFYVSSGTFAAGSTFTLYGILAA
jgi:hypothetical protein